MLKVIKATLSDLFDALWYHEVRSAVVSVKSLFAYGCNRIRPDSLIKRRTLKGAVSYSFNSF